jgi:hypothetical protein
VLKGFSIPADRAETALKVVKENGRYAGIIRDTPTGPFVSLDAPGVPAPATTPANVNEDEWAEQPASAHKHPPSRPSFAAIASCWFHECDTAGI